MAKKSVGRGKINESSDIAVSKPKSRKKRTQSPDCDDDFRMKTKTPKGRFVKGKIESSRASIPVKQPIIKPLNAIGKQSRKRSPTPEAAIRHKLEGTQFEHHCWKDKGAITERCFALGHYYWCPNHPNESKGWPVQKRTACAECTRRNVEAERLKIENARIARELAKKVTEEKVRVKTEQAKAKREDANYARLLRRTRRSPSTERIL